MKTYQFKPYNVGRWVIWSLFAIVLIFAPLIFTSNLSGTMLAQMGIAIIACLSYNILLGQGGMLSFGHAVYTGLGSFVAIHALNAITAGTSSIPVSLLPLIGGFAGIGFAVLLGYVTTKKSGTPFAMITLGVAELVFAMSLMFSEFFGGEAGISGNRVAGQTVWGITLPAAIPGIMTGAILSMSRAIGESAPLLVLGGLLLVFNTPTNLMSDFAMRPICRFISLTVRSLRLRKVPVSALKSSKRWKRS